jgi:hypothetical protein
MFFFYFVILITISSTQVVIGELTEEGQRLVVAMGGLGGKGNAALRTKGVMLLSSLSSLRSSSLSPLSLLVSS